MICVALTFGLLSLVGALGSDREVHAAWIAAAAVGILYIAAWLSDIAQSLAVIAAAVGSGS